MDGGNGSYSDARHRSEAVFEGVGSQFIVRARRAPRKMPSPPRRSSSALNYKRKCTGAWAPFGPTDETRGGLDAKSS